MLKISQGRSAMRATMFDTLEYMDELKRSGMKPTEAAAITKATSKAFYQMLETKEFTTKADLKHLELLVKKELDDSKLELTKCINESMWKNVGILVTYQTTILGIFGLLQYVSK